jgi:hypothetical protein
VAEHERGAGIPGMEGFFDGEDVGAMALEQAGQLTVDGV